MAPRHLGRAGEHRLYGGAAATVARSLHADPARGVLGEQLLESGGAALGVVAARGFTPVWRDGRETTARDPGRPHARSAAGVQ